MPTGKIKYYNPDKGYGFIAQDEGEDLFFHILKSPSAGEIKAGQRVKYEVTRGKKGWEAENIQMKRKLHDVKYCPYCGCIIKGSYKEHLLSCPRLKEYAQRLPRRRNVDILDLPSTLWGGHWESNRRRH